MSFSIYAYRRGSEDTTADLRNRRLPLDRLERTVRWVIERGCDEFVVSLDDAEPIRTDMIHHMCHHPDCPGGC